MATASLPPHSHRPHPAVRQSHRITGHRLRQCERGVNLRLQSQIGYTTITDQTAQTPTIL